MNLSSKLSFMAKADGPNLLSSYVVLGAVCRILSPDHLDSGPGLAKEEFDAGP